MGLDDQETPKNDPNPNPTLNHGQTPTPEMKHFSQVLDRVCQGKILGRIQEFAPPCQETKLAHPHTSLPPTFMTLSQKQFLLHCRTTVAPLPPPPQPI